MAKRSEGTKAGRLRRSDPEREAPNRSGSDHIRRHTTSRNGNGGKKPPGENLISETLQKAITEVVELSSDVIEEQIRAGQTAAERLRDNFANSKELSEDVHMLVDGLVATTKDVGATWLELLSIVMRSIGTKPGAAEAAQGVSHAQPRTRTKTGSSGGAATTSSITPPDPKAEAAPVEIVVSGYGVKSVTLDLRPPSKDFEPFVRELQGHNPKYSPPSVKFGLHGRQLVLLVNGARGQSPGIYAGVIVDGKSNEAGGTVSVTIGG